jgi:mono/diheme cytochrome c family protein
MNKLFKIGTQLSVAFCSTLLLTSCDIDAQKDRAMSSDPGSEYAPQMYNSIPYESLKQEEKNPYNPGGANVRVPAKNTIARGNMAFIDNSTDATTQDVMGATLVNPVKANEAVLEDGKILYTRMCAHCHGEGGAGDGLVAPKFKGVANLTSAAIKAKPVGHIYQVITKGKGRMMPHNTQINPEERWKISMYVKSALQGEGPAPAGGSTEAGESDKTTTGDAASQTESTNPVK